MNSFERFSFNLLGMRMKAKREQYSMLRNDLISARLKTSFEVYVSTAVVSSVIVGLISAIALGFFTWFLKLPNLIKYKGDVPSTVLFFSQYSLILGTVFVVIFSLLVFGGITYAVFISYPSVVAGTRRRSIDATLPYAINYITSMSTAGITPAEIFRLLGDSPIYGESSVEARYIAREIDIFGRDLIRCAQDCSFEHAFPADEGVFTGFDGQYLEWREPHGLFPYKRQTSMPSRTARPRKCSWIRSR